MAARPTPACVNGCSDCAANAARTLLPPATSCGWLLGWTSTWHRPSRASPMMPRPVARSCWASSISTIGPSWRRGSGSRARAGANSATRRWPPQRRGASRTARSRAAWSMRTRLADGDPLSEHALRRLMRLHYLRGDCSAAIAAFERFEQRLKDELGIAPVGRDDRTAGDDRTRLRRAACASGRRSGQPAAPAAAGRSRAASSPPWRGRGRRSAPSCWRARPASARPACCRSSRRAPSRSS